MLRLSIKPKLPLVADYADDLFVTMLFLLYQTGRATCFGPFKARLFGFR